MVVLHAAPPQPADNEPALGLKVSDTPRSRASHTEVDARRNIRWICDHDIEVVTDIHRRCHLR